jgi:hypothetical protein
MGYLAALRAWVSKESMFAPDYYVCLERFIDLPNDDAFEWKNNMYMNRIL